MKTINEHIAEQQAKFRALSASRQAQLRREARILERTEPHMADSSTFWRGLSARQVLSA